MANQEIINIGTLPNDGEGDPLRVAFGKINNNFSNLFATAVSESSANTVGSDPGQVIFETPANTFTNGQFTVYTSNNANSLNSQSIQLNAQISPDKTTVKFTGYGASILGTPLVNYDMDVVSGNIRLLINPLVSDDLTHIVGSQGLQA